MTDFVVGDSARLGTGVDSVEKKSFHFSPELWSVKVLLALAVT